MTNHMGAAIKNGTKSLPGEKKNKLDHSILVDDFVLEEDSSSVPNKYEQHISLILLTFLYGTLVYFSLILVCHITSNHNNKDNQQLAQSLSESWLSQKSFQAKLHDAQLFTPEQVHLSLGANSSEIYVTWSTMEPVELSELEYSLAFTDGITLDLTRRSQAKLYAIEVRETDLKWIHATRKPTRILYTYRAKLINLEPGNLYIYRAVSSRNGDKFFSKTYRYFSKDLSNPNSVVKVALFGDLGVENGKSIPRLIQSVDHDKFDLIIHNGDFAYDLDRHNGEQGDKFMRLIEPIAARIPYQTSVGNHEVKDKFIHYDHRFTMINSGSGDLKSFGELNNFYYSFNVGPIHFVSFSTEFYYFLDYMGIEYLEKQYEWLKKDLDHATSLPERTLRPWIIVFGHRPMYCSSDDNDECTRDDNILRVGLPPSGKFALEKLFYDYGVDVLFWSHEHEYERFLPIYNNQIISGEDLTKPYHNPRAPVHIIGGSAGCEERLDHFRANISIGSVERISDYGYGQLLASKCELKFEQISDDESGQVVDRFTITKTKQNFPIEDDNLTYNCSTSDSRRLTCSESDWWC